MFHKVNETKLDLGTYYPKKKKKKEKKRKHTKTKCAYFVRMQELIKVYRIIGLINNYGVKCHSLINAGIICLNMTV